MRAGEEPGVDTLVGIGTECHESDHPARMGEAAGILKEAVRYARREGVRNQSWVAAAVSWMDEVEGPDWDESYHPPPPPSGDASEWTGWPGAEKEGKDAA